MKKLFVLALILCLSMILCSAALAQETELDKNTLEGTTKVSLTIDHNENSFVVVIPASVTIDPETKMGTFDITLESGWQLISSNGLTVRIKEFANGVDKSSSSTDYDIFTLKNSVGETVKYEIEAKFDYSYDYGTSYVKLHNYTQSSPYYSPSYNNNLISVSKETSNETDRTASLKLNVPKLPTNPGEYTDTITFSVNLY